jgi:hypothetical protein
LPEDNWVWSPQGLIAMHYPEMWGFVHFLPLPAAAADSATATAKPAAGTPDAATATPAAQATRPQATAGKPDSPAGTDPSWVAMQVYYRQKAWHCEHGSFAGDLQTLFPDGPTISGVAVEMSGGPDRFLATVRTAGRTASVTEDGRLVVAQEPDTGR